MYLGNDASRVCGDGEHRVQDDFTSWFASKAFSAWAVEVVVVDVRVVVRASLTSSSDLSAIALKN